MPATDELDKELAKSLQVAKKKPRNFAIIAKGANVLKLLVDKKPLKEGPLQKAKKECQGTAIVKGIVGGDGPELVFQVLELPAIGEPKVKKFISDTTRLNVAPRFQVVSELQEINDESDDAAAADVAATASSAAAPPAAPPTAPPAAEQTLSAQQLTAALNKLSPAIKQALADHPSRKEQIGRPVVDFQAHLKAGELAQAKESLLKIGGLLKSLKDEAVESVPGVQAREKQVDQERAREKEAAAIRAELDQIKDPAGAGKYQKRLDEKRQVVTEAVAKGDFETARQGLAGVQGELTQVTYEIGRDQMLKKYYAAANPAGVSDEQLKRLEQQRQRVLAQLPAQAQSGDLVETEKQLQALGSLIVTVGQELTARAEHLRRLDAARQRLKASRSTFPLPPPNVIDEKFNLAKNAGETATSVQAFGQANLLIDQMDQTLAAAEEYSKLYDYVRDILMMGGASLEESLLKKLTDFRNAAQDKADQGDFPGAVQELQKIKQDSSIEEAADYQQALNEFWTAVDKLPRSPQGLPDDQDPRKIFASDKKGSPLVVAKAKALLKPPQFKDAAQKVRTLVPQVKDLEACRQRLFELYKVKQNAKIFDSLAQTIQDKVQQTYQAAVLLACANEPDFKAAQDKLDELGTETVLKQCAAYLKLLPGVEFRQKAIQSLASGSAAAVHVQGLLDAARQEAEKGNYAGATLQLGNLKPIAIAAHEYVEQDRAVRDLCEGLDPVVVSGLLKPSVERAAGENYGGAVDLLKALPGSIADVRSYFDRQAEVEALRKLLPGQQEELDEVRDRSEKLVQAGDYAGALAVLNELQQMPEFKEVDRELGPFLKELAAVTREHAATQKLLDQKELKEFLTQTLSEAQAEAQPGGDLKQGRQKVAALAELLRDARAYAKERQMTKAMVECRSQEERSRPQPGAMAANRPTAERWRRSRQESFFPHGLEEVSGGQRPGQERGRDVGREHRIARTRPLPVRTRSEDDAGEAAGTHHDGHPPRRRKLPGGLCLQVRQDRRLYCHPATRDGNGDSRPAVQGLEFHGYAPGKRQAELETVLYRARTSYRHLRHRPEAQGRSETGGAAPRRNGRGPDLRNPYHRERSHPDTLDVLLQDGENKKSPGHRDARERQSQRPVDLEPTVPGSRRLGTRRELEVGTLHDAAARKLANTHSMVRRGAPR